jgi:predicted ATPase
VQNIEDFNLPKMYIDNIEINNLRAIENLEIQFRENEYAGWHVIIGDNGSGKSTFVKAVVIDLIKYDKLLAFFDFQGFLRQNCKLGESVIIVKQDDFYDSNVNDLNHEQFIRAGFAVISERIPQEEISQKLSEIEKRDNFPGAKPENYLWNDKNKGWFSAAYGPFRRFRGGDNRWVDIAKNNPKIAAHISVFGEDVALTEVLEWLKDLNYKRLEGKPEGVILEDVKKFLNSGGLLPFNTYLESVSSDGVFFKDGNGATIEVVDLSDGYRSVLSLTFDLVRQLIRCYGADLVFANIRKGEMSVDLPGVVLIDEIDSHLHPTWQTRIGQWFTQYFPKIQFIVTTHSPLICRGAIKGSVWRLPSPASGEQTKEITGTALERLIYGNVLDAYGTEVFGKGVARSEAGKTKIERMAKLNMKSIKGTIAPEEKMELDLLRSIFPTE